MDETFCFNWTLHALACVGVIALVGAFIKGAIWLGQEVVVTIIGFALIVIGSATLSYCYNTENYIPWGFGLSVLILGILVTTIYWVRIWAMWANDW